MTQSVGTLKTAIVADASGFAAGMDRAAAAVKTGSAKIRSSLSGLSSVMRQTGGLIPAEMTGFVDFLANPKMLGIAGLGTAFSVMQKFAGEAKEISRGAQRLGMGVVEYQELDIAAKKSGSSIEEAGSAVNRMRRAISSAFHGQDGASSLFKELGLSVLQLERMDPAEAFERVAQAVLKIRNPMERARVEMQIFGKSGAMLEPLLQEVAGGLDQYRGETTSAAHIAALEKSKLAVTRETKNWFMRMAGRAAFNTQALGEMAGSWSQGDFVSLNKAADRLDKQYEIEEKLKRSKIQGSSASEVTLGYRIPTALAPLIMSASQAAASLEGQTQDNQAAMVDLLSKIAKNTDPFAGRSGEEAE